MRVAVIGAGARFALAAYIRDAGGQVVVVADVDSRAEDRARSVLDHDVRFVSSHHEVDEVDGAFVLTPDGTHAGIAADLLARGIPVYLEKPMALDIDDCDVILAAAMQARIGEAPVIGRDWRNDCARGPPMLARDASRAGTFFLPISHARTR